MKTHYALVAIFAVCLFFSWSIIANATASQLAIPQTIVTPVASIPITTTQSPLPCFPQGSDIYTSACWPSDLMRQAPAATLDSTPGTVSQAGVTIWQSVNSPVAVWLNSVAMLSPNDGWAVGDGGAIVRWNGTSWASVASPLTTNLLAVYMLSVTDGWAVGDGGKIIRWNGTSWQNFTSPTALSLRGLHMLSATDGWIVGGDTPSSVILRWNGASWTTVASPAPWPAILIDVTMVSPTDGWAVGNYGTILRWNGSAWHTVPSPTGLYIISIDMVSATDGWAVGGLYPNGQILHWNGSSWQIYTAPASNELASVSMVNAADGWAVSRWGSELLHWNGVNWTKSSSPRTVGAVDMLSSLDGWAVGYGILHYAPFNGLTAHVIAANGQPASNASVVVFQTNGNYAGNGTTNSSGDAWISVSPGTYHVSASSASDHFGLYQLNVTSPASITLSAVGHPTFALSALTRAGAPLQSIYLSRSAQPSLPMYLGQGDANGHMTFTVISDTYNIVAFDWVYYYFLALPHQPFSNTGGAVNFDASTIPTADIVASHPGVADADLVLIATDARWGVSFPAPEGRQVVVSGNQKYRLSQTIRMTDTANIRWHYDIYDKRANPMFASGEVYTYTAGGPITISGRTLPATIGTWITLTNPLIDGYGNSLKSIYTRATTSSYYSIYPRITLTDPHGRVTIRNNTWATEYFMPYTATIGTYAVHYELDTGPYQGMVTADSTFETKLPAASAVVTVAGGVLTSTYDGTAYIFPSNTFSDTVIVTHTTVFTAPSAGGLIPIFGHSFDLTAVYSSTGQPAQPAQPYTITVSYSDAQRGLAVENTLALYWWDGSQWVKEPSSVVDTVANTVTATPNHFSLWAILGETRRVFLPLVLKN